MPKAHNTSDAFEAAYRAPVRPPWDHDSPAAFVVELAEAGAFPSPVLDAGCGTGENALYLAARGLEVVGVDAAETAIARARAKASQRGSKIEFRIADARVLDEQFDAARFASVLDCGLFHVFAEADDRARYGEALWRVTSPGAVLHLLCFSELNPSEPGARASGFGTHGITRAELEQALSLRWSLEAIEPLVQTLQRPGQPGAEKRFWLTRWARRVVAD